MKIILDTNILMSALIKDSTTRKLIRDSKFSFYFPLISFKELDKYKDLVLKKSKINEIEYNILLLSLLTKIKMIPFHIIKPYINKASKIMSKIDPEDVIFIAASIALNCPIWSNDRHFKKQKRIKIFTTKDILGKTSRP